MEQASLVLFWFAFALYVGATVLYAYQFVLRRSKVSWWARFLTGAGFICQTLSIGANSIVHHGTTFTGQNQLVLASWALVLLYFVMEHILRIRAYGAFLVPIAVIVMVVAQLTGNAAVAYQLTDEQFRQIQGYGIAFHVAMIVFANAGFAFGSVSAGLYLFQSTQLKNRKTSKLSRRLPSLATLQQVAHRAVSLAFPVYTAGLTLGMIRAIQTDVSGWWQDPRVMMSGLVWVTFGVYLVAVYRHNVSSRFSAWLSIVGFVFVVIVAVLARTVPIGFHIFGV
ncbi:MAG TPA: cytochrome c biogenesis protein CcsA [Coriobacteriia bacterium]|nr:cytochrome c biogenesis protein CcsA [Coriobacteriia bacterium]